MKLHRRLLFLVVVLGLAACWQEKNLTESEKLLFLRAHDLVAYGYGFKPIDRYESFTKTRYFDGSQELEYEFETPDGEHDYPLYLLVTVTIERKSSDALLSQKAERLGMQIGLKAEEIKIEEVKDSLKYGDESSFGLLLKDGRPVGNLFTVRDGARLYSVVLAGMYFDDPQVWDEIIMPKLKKLREYKSS